MTPDEIAASYDALAERWLDVSTYGFAQVERAVAFVKHKGHALDVGCGTGRLMPLLRGHGFRADGIDVSPGILDLARRRYPDAELFQADVREWEPSRRYDLVVAWDSVWHVPLCDQESVLTKLCHALSPGGVIVFTTGGTDGPDERHNPCEGLPMYHAAMGIPKTLDVLAAAGCVLRHLEYDRYPESHVFIVAQKADDARHGVVALRRIAAGDLPRMYEMQIDPESNRMAVTNPRSAEAFQSLWTNILADENNEARAILLDGEFVGHISCFPADGKHHVGYWIDRASWGRGVASRALALFLRKVTSRPLYATTAASNAASRRVLRKCGFAEEGVRSEPACERYPACEVAGFVLR